MRRRGFLASIAGGLAAWMGFGRKAEGGTRAIASGDAPGWVRGRTFRGAEARAVLDRAYRGSPRCFVDCAFLDLPDDGRALCTLGARASFIRCTFRSVAGGVAIAGLCLSPDFAWPVTDCRSGSRSAARTTPRP